MKIKMLNDVTIETVGHNEEGYKSREEVTFFKGDSVEVEITREKKGMAEMTFMDGFVGKMCVKDFEKVA
jgi:hypothetical protein